MSKPGIIILRNVKSKIGAREFQLFATKYMPYLPTEDELIAEIEREKLILKKQFEE